MGTIPVEQWVHSFAPVDLPVDNPNIRARLTSILAFELARRMWDGGNRVLASNGIFSKFDPTANFHEAVLAYALHLTKKSLHILESGEQKRIRLPNCTLPEPELEDESLSTESFFSARGGLSSKVGDVRLDIERESRPLSLTHGHHVAVMMVAWATYPMGASEPAWLLNATGKLTRLSYARARQLLSDAGLPSPAIQKIVKQFTDIAPIAEAPVAV